MIDNSNPLFVVPRNEEPSHLRRVFRRTLYLRLLDGEFILWCFETGRMARHASDLLRHQRVIISDTQAFGNDLLKAMNEVGVGSVPGRRRLLILHCLRFLPSRITPTEQHALYEMWRSLGNSFFVFHPDQKVELTESAIVTLCHDVGAFNRQLTKSQPK